MKYKKVSLRVKSDNTPALELYKKFGFEVFSQYKSNKDKKNILKMELSL